MADDETASNSEEGYASFILYILELQLGSLYHTCQVSYPRGYCHLGHKVKSSANPDSS